MRFFIDTANVEEIKKASDMGVICGVTTNPSLIAKEGRELTLVENIANCQGTSVRPVLAFFLASELHSFLQNMLQDHLEWQR